MNSFMAGNSLQLALEGLTVFIEDKRRAFQQYPDPELKEVMDLSSEERDKLLTQLQGRG